MGRIIPMDKTMRYICIRPGCGNAYEANEPDADYCPSCKEANKQKAALIDANLRPTPRGETDLQRYDRLPKVYGKYVDAKHFF